MKKQFPDTDLPNSTRPRHLPLKASYDKCVVTGISLPGGGGKSIALRMMAESLKKPFAKNES